MAYSSTIQASPGLLVILRSSDVVLWLALPSHGSAIETSCNNGKGVRCLNEIPEQEHQLVMLRVAQKRSLYNQLLNGMPIDLLSVLPGLLPKAIEWANARSSEILAGGEPLDETDLRLAMAVGVSDAVRIRVSTVSALPLPEDPELREMALETGLLGPNMIGLTLGYGIYVCEGHKNQRLISHECRHVYQYETAGSIEQFLPFYLHQIAFYGYQEAPFEIDAREHEINVG